MAVLFQQKFFNRPLRIKNCPSLIFLLNSSFIEIHFSKITVHSAGCDGLKSQRKGVFKTIFILL